MKFIHDLKGIIKGSFLYPFLLRVKVWRQNEWKAQTHKKILNSTAFFYTLSPILLVAISKAFKYQHLNRSGGTNFSEGHGYYEFGLFKGFSFWFAEQMSRDYVGNDFQFYGFDSFEGLPKSEVDSDYLYWREGNYAASIEYATEKLKDHGTDLKKVKLFKGFYSKHHFDSLRKSNSFLPISICVIDSDIYESCVEVLDFIKDLLVPGSILLFDDYNFYDGAGNPKGDNHGERRAMKEFEESNPTFSKEHLFDFGRNGVAFRVTGI